jgi:hypothetical protein
MPSNGKGTFIDKSAYDSPFNYGRDHLPPDVLVDLSSKAQVVGFRAALALERANKDLKDFPKDEDLWHHFKATERAALESLTAQWVIEHGVSATPPDIYSNKVALRSGTASFGPPNNNPLQHRTKIWSW